ncbi:hypothetical protein [Sphingobacterium siyangense]|uniref:hypothetical protein n=1 Tax=Sphingobacterium siyangense TaxID=459529 RepID=UPI00301A29EE
MKKIHFEDNGQDFLWWEIDPDGVVVGCGPFQHNVWVGSTVINHLRLRAGGPVYFISNQGKKLTLIHKILIVENQ